MERIQIFDTTLRDGEQSPGCSMNLKEKIQMARQLERMKVDVIEAGFAISSIGDFESVQAIANDLKYTSVGSLARSNIKDIDRAWEAVKGGANPMIHTFIATSPIHMEYKLRMSPDEVVEAAVAAVKRCKGYTSNVEFSAEDASRSEKAFLYRIVEAVIDAGATVVNIPDTVGYTTPELFYDLIKSIRNNVPNIDKAIISVHCHNDLGLAVANSLSAVRAGARQVECTVNGIGERAGNASVEEIIMTLNTRKDFYQVETNIDTTQLVPSSRLLQSITGVKVQPHKAIVGVNAFAHEAGIHQHGVLMNRETYEIMTPESVGWTTNTMVLGKHSGKHAFRAHLENMGFHFDDDRLEQAFKAFKDLADRKKVVYDQDILTLILDDMSAMNEEYTLEDYFTIRREKLGGSTTVVTVGHKGENIERIGKGDGPIDAAFDALGQIMGKDFVLADFKIRSVTKGKDALGETVVTLQIGDQTFSGKGVSTDIIESSILAYLNAVNHISYFRERQSGGLVEGI